MAATDSSERGVRQGLAWRGKMAVRVAKAAPKSGPAFTAGDWHDLTRFTPRNSDIILAVVQILLFAIGVSQSVGVAKASQ